MKIAIVSAFYSEGMGYTENCLPRSLAALGHEVHVLTSRFNVYGNSADYDQTYREFLGPADQGTGTFVSNEYTVHRLESSLVSSYVHIRGLAGAIARLKPQIVHCTEIASLQSFMLAALRPFGRFRFFAETHQHMSVVKPFLKESHGHLFKKAAYWATRTLPTACSSLTIEMCYAIAPDCVEVAHRYYGVPLRKLKLQSLGTDTALFRPAENAEEVADRKLFRDSLGYDEDAIVCVYTGRFSNDKNPLALARAVDSLSEQGGRFRAIFVGAGPQQQAILQCRHTRTLAFMTHSELARLYRACDIAVWPRQESMSMLDAAATGLPLIVSTAIGESARVSGNGAFYDENDPTSMATALTSLASRPERERLGAAGRAKMIEHFSWKLIAKSIEADYAAACGEAPPVRDPGSL